MFWKKYRYLVILMLVAVGIRIFSFYPVAVEHYYTQGIYPYITASLRFLLGWIPFSIGDILYALAIIYLLRGLVLLIRRLIQRTTNKKYWLALLKKTVQVVLWIYILFNALWGLNYNRIGIAQQLNLHVQKYEVWELSQVLKLTVDKLHELDTIALQQRDSFYTKRVLFAEAIKSYKQVVRGTPVLEYNTPSVKPSLFSYLGNYLGYSGYYNPFTAEAQVNTTIPVVLQPFVASHEIGHQLGFAKESEANFAGYLAARVSTNPAVRYSVYFDLYIYASRNLARHDSLLAKSFQQNLPQIVKEDLRALRTFYNRYENPLEPLISKLYGHYLRANEQPEGILSYDEVLAWVIAYYRKYGEI